MSDVAGPATPVAVLIAAIRYAFTRIDQHRQVDIATHVHHSAPHLDSAGRAWLAREIADQLRIGGDLPGAPEVWGPVMAECSREADR